MPRGDKSAYTDKQKRQAEHIEEGYKEKGVPAEAAEKRAWATVNKGSGGGRKSGSGRGKAENKEPFIKGGRKGGRAGGKAGGRATATRPKAKSARSKAGKADRKGS
jgi:plasmid stabilization system protein ParE